MFSAALLRQGRGLAARTLSSRLPSSAFFSSAAGLDFSLTSEQRSIQQLARDFAAKEVIPASKELDVSGAWPRELFNKAWAAGLVNPHIPQRYGGLGLGLQEGVLIAEELAYADMGFCTAAEINTVAEVPLLLAGTEAQKKSWLGRMTEEPLVAAYCVTEAGAGSDVAGLKTTARKVGDEWVINGSKMWISNGGVADWYFVLARTGQPGDPPGKAFTAFVVDRHTPGVSLGQKERMMGQRCSDTRGITFEDVRVPAGNIVGAEGKGFKVAMGCFDYTRPPVAAGAIGIARRAMDEAINYSLQRKTMGRPIAQHQAVAFKIADMATGIEASRLLTWKASWLLDNGHSNTVAASMAKLYASEHCKRAVSEAVQIFGGLGFNEDAPVAKLYRDSAITTIYEGTSEIQKLIISRALLEELVAAVAPSK